MVLNLSKLQGCTVPPFQPCSVAQKGLWIVLPHNVTFDSTSILWKEQYERQLKGGLPKNTGHIAKIQGLTPQRCYLGWLWHFGDTGKPSTLYIVWLLYFLDMYVEWRSEKDFKFQVLKMSTSSIWNATFNILPKK